jgi:hypothetical protein
MSNIKDSCDAIEGIIEILIKIKSTINPKTDVVWTGYDTPEQLEQMIDRRINELKNKELEYISDFYSLFAPTGVFQELSLSNGWGNEFIALASEFDGHYEVIISKRPS